MVNGFWFLQLVYLVKFVQMLLWGYCSSALFFVCFVLKICFGSGFGCSFGRQGFEDWILHLLSNDFGFVLLTMNWACYLSAGVEGCCYCCIVLINLLFCLISFYGVSMG